MDRQNNFAVEGFKDRNRKTIEKVEVGDKFAIYIKHVQRIGAIVTATSGFYYDDRAKIWIEDDEIWPCRFETRPELVLPEDNLLDVKPLVPLLRFVTDKQKGTKWGLAFQGSLRKIPQQDFELIETEMRRLLERQEKGKEETKRTFRSYHDQIKEMLYEIGQMEGRVSEKEYRIDGERIDVVWKRIETGNPHAVFEVQIGGNFYEALAKLKHAWDKWNSRPFLVTTEQYRGRALEWVRGSFHEIERQLNIVDCERVKELHEAVNKTRSLKEELGII